MKTNGLLLTGSLSLILAASSLNTFADTSKHPLKDYKGMAMPVAE